MQLDRWLNGLATGITILILIGIAKIAFQKCWIIFYFFNSYWLIIELFNP